jgi:hypothetical protein
MTVEATLTYLAPLRERPYYYEGEPPPGVPWRNTHGDRRLMTLGDARALDAAPTLDIEGFRLTRFTTAAGDLYDADTIRRVYYREVEELVKAIVGASRVVAFDHNVRSAAAERRNTGGVQTPVRFAHNDYTERSGPQRVQDLLPDEATALLRGRFAVLNVWKPIKGPVESAPLAVCAAPTIDPHDFIEMDLIYRDRKGEVYALLYNPNHRWFFFPRMQVDEALVFKGYDSERGVARFTAHTAFDDPTAPADAAPRESIEVRTLAFY